MAAAFLLCTSAALVAQSGPDAGVAKGCEDNQDRAVTKAREFLEQALIEGEIILFAHLENPVFRSPACLNLRREGSGFNLDYQFYWGRGALDARVAFHFSADGEIQEIIENQEVPNPDPYRYVSIEELLIEPGKEALTAKIEHEINDDIERAIFKIVVAVFSPYVKGHFTLIQLLKLEQRGTISGPPDETLDDDDRFVATGATFQFIPLLPQDALLAQGGARYDYTQELKKAEMVHAGRQTKLTPVLDGVVANIPEEERRRHRVKGSLGPDAPVLFAKSDSVVLVKLSDGRFGMVPESYLADQSVFFAAERLLKPALVGIPLEHRIYKGTADGFAAAFPGFLKQAAETAHIDPHSYEEETDYIIGVVRTCAQITQIARSTGRSGYDLAWKLGDQYKICRSKFLHPSDEAKVPKRDPERGLVMSMHPSRAEWGNGFVVQVWFNNLKTETFPSVDILFESLGIIVATIN